jgi:hypothetical protein
MTKEITYSAEDHEKALLKAFILPQRQDRLRREGAPDACYCISESHDLDAKTLPLLEALREVVGRDMGTFLSGLPGRLAYFERILERKQVR